MRIHIYNESHPAAGREVDADTLDAHDVEHPGEEPDWWSIEGTATELLAVADQYDRRNSRYAWRVARTIRCAVENA